MDSSYKNIVVFGNAKWSLDSLGNSAQQLSLAFLRLGHCVIYISPYFCPPICLADFPKTFIHLSPRRHPIFGWLEKRIKTIPFLALQKKLFSLTERVKKNDTSEIKKYLDSFLAEHAWTPENTLFIVNFCNKMAKKFVSYFKAFRYPIIYRHVDWWDESHKKYGFRTGILKFALTHANLVTLSHPELIKNLPKKHKNIFLAQNGIDLTVFRPFQHQPLKPDDLFQGEITLGFWGTFWGGCIDWKLLVHLAQKNPGWQLNLIADALYLDIPRNDLPQNIHLLGSKKPHDLPRYLYFFDVCLIPFRQDMNFSKFANPIKALEYLSGFKPIITPHNKSLTHYPGVFFYSSSEEAEKMILKAKDTRLNQNDVMSFLNSNSWEKRATDLLGRLNRL